MIARVKMEKDRKHEIQENYRGVSDSREGGRDDDIDWKKRSRKERNRDGARGKSTTMVDANRRSYFEAVIVVVCLPGARTEQGREHIGAWPGRIYTRRTMQTGRESLKKTS